MAISKIGSKALVDCSVAAVDIADGSITSAKLAGSIANAKLANSSITVNGTSVSLGASGSIPAVSWQSVITADGSTATSAVAGNGYFIDTTSNAHTINLPGSPSAGDTIAIKDYAATFGTNNLTIGRNGNNIQGVANDSLITTNRASLTLVYVDATKGWLYAVESNVADLQVYTSATGGTVTTSGDYKIHTFTGDGCFVVSAVGTPSTVDYLVVAGGGGGGGSAGGGGGAGGFRLGSCVSCKPALASTALPVTTQTYPITVGAGGAGGPSSPPRCGSSGNNSIFSTITSAGGGFGSQAVTAGGNGGSGGGGGNSSPSPGGTGNTPPVSPPQGSNGGSGSLGCSGSRPGGGGGGAAAVGTDGPPDGSAPNSGGPGGAGSPVTDIFGASPQPFYPVPGPGEGSFSGGGGGGVARGDTPFNPNTASAGGIGGGGAGGAGDECGTAGVTNSGGGGGAGGGGLFAGACQGNGAAGGKGIVIIRYKFQ